MEILLGDYLATLSEYEGLQNKKGGGTTSPSAAQLTVTHIAHITKEIGVNDAHITDVETINEYLQMLEALREVV